MEVRLAACGSKGSSSQGSPAPTRPASPASSPRCSAPTACAADGYARFVFPNGSSIAVVPPDWVAPPSDTNLGFLVDDLGAATAELAARGLEPAGELEESDGYRYRHFRAPDGRVFELLERRA